MRLLFSISGFFSMLGIFAGICGCNVEQTSSLPMAPVQWDEAAHGQSVHVCPTEGPHRGQLIEVGRGDYRAEFIHDEAIHLVGIYLLDAQATAPVPVAESALTINLLIGGKPAQFRLPAAPLDGEGGQHSSHFELQDEKLCEVLDLPGTKPRFNVTIQGKHFVIAIAHHVHKHDRVAKKF